MNVAPRGYFVSLNVIHTNIKDVDWTLSPAMNSDASNQISQACKVPAVARRCNGELHVFNCWGCRHSCVFGQNVRDCREEEDEFFSSPQSSKQHNKANFCGIFG